MHYIFLLLFSMLLLGEVQADSTEVRMLTWNVFLRPRAFFKDVQMQRVPPIIRFLKEEKYDVVVLQEVFDKKALRLIKEGLVEVYPHTAGPGKRGLIKINSGVLILSKHPIQKKVHLTYKAFRGYDRMSRKGAFLAEITKNGSAFQVYGTHCQSGGDNNADVRILQWQALSAFMVEHGHDSIPRFVLGDLNEEQHKGKGYAQMIKVLQMHDGPHDGGYTTCNLLANDLVDVAPNAKQKVIDYVLWSYGDQKIRVQRKIRTIQKPWSKRKRKGTYLSDHAAVEVNISWR